MLISLYKVEYILHALPVRTDWFALDLAEFGNVTRPDCLEGISCPAKCQKRS